VLDLWTDLLGCLDLRRANDSPDGDDVIAFDGISQQLDYHRVFGGQLLGQFIRAAGSFASLTITAHQPHAVLASAAVSMHASEGGPENQDCEPVSTLLDEAHRVELDLIPWETRCTDDLGAAATGPPRLEVASYAQEALVRFRDDRELVGA
jgi:acyl-CoA thioesterase-2